MHFPRELTPFAFLSSEKSSDQYIRVALGANAPLDMAMVLTTLRSTLKHGGR